MRHMTTYRFLDAVAKIGSMRRAAEQLAITPSALNRRILAVEEEFGTQLFERLPHGLRLNTAGELVIQHVRRQMADLERVQSSLADISGERRGHITIACSQSVYTRLLPEAIARYQSEHPLVTFDVRSAEATAAEAMLEDFSVDLAFVMGLRLDRSVQVLAQKELGLYAVMRSDHPLAAGQGDLKLFECLDHPIAALSKKYSSRQVLMFAAEKLGLDLKIALEADDTALLIEAARAGDFLALRVGPLPWLSLLPDQGGQLIARPINRKSTGSAVLSLAQLKNRTLSVAASRFAEALTKAI